MPRYTMTYLSAVLFGVLIFYVGLSFGIKKFDTTADSWPIITKYSKCRICLKPILVWQSHERRHFNVVLDNPNQLAVAVNSSGIVHKYCKGTPTVNAKIE